jgi:DNA end-binding protein Ku
MARATWKGAIRISLITIPIRVFPATNPGSDVSFRQLHRRCKTPIQLKKWCAHCEEEVPAEDIVKGYESSKGQFVLVEEEEISKLRPESTRVIDIAHVVDAAKIDPLLIERAYFLAPDTKIAGPSFAVLRESIDGRAGVGRLALHGREYLVAVLARDEALLMYTLRTSGEVRSAGNIDELEFARVKAKPDEVKLARQVLQHYEQDVDLSTFTDHYQESLRAMLQAKAPDSTVVTKGGKPAGKVVDLMEALRQSLARVSSEKPRGARAKKPARMRVVAHPAGKRRKAS